MSKNLEKFSTKSSNSDWQEWVKLVKQAYKSKGHTLTQAQALIVAKKSYPGKGNVHGAKESEVPISEEIPEQPKRRPRPPRTNEAPKVYKRSVKEGSESNSRRPSDRSEFATGSARANGEECSPDDKECPYYGDPYYVYDRRRDSPPRERARRREEETPSPPRRRYRSRSPSPLRSRSRRERDYY